MLTLIAVLFLLTYLANYLGINAAADASKSLDAREPCWTEPRLLNGQMFNCEEEEPDSDL